MISCINQVNRVARLGVPWQNDVMPSLRCHDLGRRHNLPALRGAFQPHRGRPRRDCPNACDRGFVRSIPALLVNPGGCIGVGSPYLTWTADNLLRHTVYVGLREDKPADQVRRER
jgi:ATP-dependent DNA ligase